MMAKMKPTRYKVSLRITHPFLDLSFVAAAIGLQPSYIWKTGDKRKTPKGTILDGYRDNSYCIIDVKGSSQSSLRDQVEDLFSRIMPHKHVFDKISCTGGDISLYIGWFSSGDSGNGLDLVIIKKMIDLNMSLQINVYCSDCADLHGETA